LDLLSCLAQQASLQRFPLIPTSFLLKGWPATSGDGARSGKPPLAAKKLLLEPVCVDTTMESVDTLSQFCKTGLLGTGSSVDTAAGYVDTLSHLNVDGAGKGNPGECGGGGCIRDRRGHVYVAFAHYYGFENSMLAETRALCDGLRLANMLGLRLSIVNSDSK
ncbi:hypothetical protein Taro_055214, partial [Colocasia esculenta]|nr:hypothetical protein [Colocasia esculenta]